MKNIYRNYYILFFLVVFLSLVACGNGEMNMNVERGNFPPPINTDFMAEEPFFFQVDVGENAKLKLQGINGEVDISGLPGADSVVIAGKRRVRSFSKLDAEAHLPELSVNVQHLQDEVFVETVQPLNTGGRQYIVDYVITLPMDLAIEVANINGTVKLDSIDNTVRVDNVNGTVTLTEIFGNGMVTVVNGMIDGEITLPAKGSIALTTTNGDINLDIPTDTSAALSATVNLGSVSDSNLVILNEVSTSTSLSGTLGSGEGTITLEAEETGNINMSGF